MEVRSGSKARLCLNYIAEKNYLKRVSLFAKESKSKTTVQHGPIIINISHTISKLHHTQTNAHVFHYSTKKLSIECDFL